MKKSILILFIAASLLLCGCSGGDSKPAVTQATTAETTASEPVLQVNGDTYVITEDKYLEGVQEIYDNRDSYIGKRIEFEGEYIAELYGSEMYYQVYRYVTVAEQHEDEDGAAHSHASERYEVGFRIKYDGNKPSDKSFVKVSGIVESYEMNGENYLIINADLLEKSDSAGKIHLIY